METQIDPVTSYFMACLAFAVVMKIIFIGLDLIEGVN